MRDIWFIADTHFDHKGIIRHQPERARSWPNIYFMNQEIVDGINDYVKPRDLLVHAGDFGWKNSRLGKWRQRLNVKELWVAQGNHDPNSLRRNVSKMETQLTLKYGDQRVIVQHCPMFSWPGREDGVIHLYGHSHGTSEEFLDLHFPHRHSMDVGLDHLHSILGEWRPIHIDEIINFLEI